MPLFLLAAVPVRLCVQPVPAAQFFGDGAHKKPGNMLEEQVVHSDLPLGHILRGSEFVHRGLVEISGPSVIPPHLRKGCQHFSPAFLIRQAKTEQVALEQRPGVVAAKLGGQRFQIRFAAAALTRLWEAALEQERQLRAWHGLRLQAGEELQQDAGDVLHIQRQGDEEVVAALEGLGRAGPLAVVGEIPDLRGVPALLIARLKGGDDLGGIAPGAGPCRAADDD